MSDLNHDEVMQVLSALASLDTVPIGPNEDEMCPFPECSRDESLRLGHDGDCPIYIARRLLAVAQS